MGAGILLVLGLHEMVEMIWGLFTRFEGVPDLSALGWSMLGWGALALLAAVPVAVLGIVWRWLSPGQ